MEEKEVIEKRTIRREEPVNKVTNVNIGPDGTTNVQESGDEVVESCRSYRLLNFNKRGPRPPEHHVLPDAAREDKRVLGDDPRPRPQRAQTVVAEIHAIDGDAALRGTVERHEQLEQRRFS